jgi:serine/threonine protein kinase
VTGTGSNGTAAADEAAHRRIVDGVRIDVQPLGAGDRPTIDAYTLLGRIGEGGQGRVYLATAPAEPGRPNNPLVAVKALHPQLLTDPQSRERLGAEVAAARRVPAFCTARLLDARLAGPTPYLVTEFVDGPSLQAQVRAHGPMTGDALDRLAVGTLTALITIHRAGLVHHDVKPGNVLLGPDGPRVVDFGIAAPIGTAAPGASSHDGILATPAFMSPEQLDPGQVTTAADLFSWASTMTFAATGRSPFHAGDQAGLLHRLEHEAPVLAGVPDHLRPLLRACLAKDPHLRPSAQQALTRLLEDLQPDAGRRPAWAASGTGVPSTSAPCTGVPGAPPRHAPSSPDATAPVHPPWGSPDPDPAPRLTPRPASGRSPSIPPAAPVPPAPPRPPRPPNSSAGTRSSRGRSRRHRPGRVLAVVAVITAIKLGSGINGDAAHALTVPLPDQVLTRSAFSPDGRLVATLNSGGELSWRSARDPESLVHALSMAAHDLSGGVMSSNGSRLATISSDGVVQVWDVGSQVWDTGTAKPIGLPLPGVYHAGSVSLSSDGSTVAVQGTFSGGPGQAVRVWSVGQSAWLTTPQPAAASGLSASGGTLLLRPAAGPTNDLVSLRSAVTDKEIDSVAGCDGVPSLSADEGWLVCTGGVTGVHLVHRVGGAQHTVDVPGPAGASAAAASSGGQLAAVAGPAGLSVLDLSDDRPSEVAHVQESLGEVRGLAFDQDGTRVAVITGDGLTVVDVPQD